MLLLGDCLEQMKTLADNSVDAVVTDPPYGLSKEPNISEVMQHWINGDKYEHDSKGFMGKSWDSFVPGPEYWREVYRVMKPGAHIIAFAGTRTWDLMSMSLRFAGFENRDTIASFGGPPAIAWTFGSGFPKSHNVSKAIDKMAGAEREIVGSRIKNTATHYYESGAKMGRANYGVGQGDAKIVYENIDLPITAPATPEAKTWDGWGSALKPAWEVALVFRKPLEKGLTLAENVLKYNTGAINIDGARTDVSANDPNHRKPSVGYANGSMFNLGGRKNENLSPQGRWPANVLLGCACEPSPYVYPDGSTEFHHEDDCAVKMLDAQSGTLKSGAIKAGQSQGKNFQQSHARIAQYDKSASSGGASRFFYVAKASKSERSKGLDSLDCCQIKHDSCDENTELETSILKVIFGSMPNLNTVVSGDHIMVTCPKECTSIIRTAIQQITESKTWNWLIHSLTSVSTLDAPCETVLGTNLAECVEKLKELTRQTGTSQGRDGSLMADAAHATYQKLLNLSDEKNWKTFSSFHPTVKPVRLMEYLCKLITPPKGTILDPFMGSGSTGVAAKNLGFNFIGIERDPEYHAIAQKRIESVKQNEQLEIEECAQSF